MTDERERDSNPATCTWVVFAKGRGVVRCGAHARNLLDALERTRVPRHVCALPRAVRS